jgi:ribosome maturation factor RimP
MVSSPGLDQPFMVKEQYVKNINKDIKVLLKTGETFEGNLVTVSDDEIIIKIKGDKKIKKGQKPDLIEKIIKNEEIKSTKSVIKI